MRKLIVSLALFLTCTAQQFNPPYVNSDQVVPGATVGSCVKANPGGFLTSGSCGAGGATVPNPSATGDTLFSANGSTFSILGIGTNGQCLLVATNVPSWGACGGGGGGPTLAATQTWTGLNSFNPASGPDIFLGPTTGTVNQNMIEYMLDSPSNNIGAIGHNSTTTCFATTGGSLITGSLFTVRRVGPPSSPVLVADNSGLCTNARMAAESGFFAATGGSLTAGQGAVNETSTGAELILGHAGDPTATACVNGSMLVRTDGGVGSTLYVCEATVWVASAV